MDTAQVLPPELDAGPPAGKETTVTVNDAILALEEERKDHHSLPTDRTGQALQLGIEALASIRTERSRRLPSLHEPLPSESD